MTVCVYSCYGYRVRVRVRFRIGDARPSTGSDLDGVCGKRLGQVRVRGGGRRRVSVWVTALTLLICV